MAEFKHLETDTGTNVDISAATAVGAYTANGDKLIMVDVSIDAVAGNGDYVMYVTRQIGGSGSAYRILPQTTMAAASGLTAISGQSGWITVRNGDVLTCYVDGLAGDTSTPDWTTRWFELAGVTAAAVADAVLDEATSGHTSAGTFGKAVSDILADTGTDGVVVGSIAADAINAGAVKADAVTKLQNGLATPTNITAASGVELKSTQPAITWAQQRIVADVANEGALHIENTNAYGYGQANEGGVGQMNYGRIGQYNISDTSDGFAQCNEADGLRGIAQFNAAYNSDGIAQKNEATGAGGIAVSGHDPALSTDSHLQDVENKLDALDTEIADILADTNELQAELADGGRTDLLIDAIKAKTDLIPASPAEAGEYTAAIAAVKSVADDILVDTGTTLDTLIKDIPTNTELATALGTADDAVLAAVAAAKVVIDDIHNTDLPAVKAETALIVEDTGTTIPALLETIDNFLDTEVAAIKAKTDQLTFTTANKVDATATTDTSSIAGDVWSSPIRTLTVPSVAAAATEDGTTLTLYKDADINIEFTGLTIPTGAKKVIFTIKDNLDDADTASALQATYQLTAVPAETHTLNYINSAVPPVLTTPVTFTVDTDSVEFDMTAAAAYYLPRYERGYLHWDLKLITDTTVQILQQGLVQILGTSTRAVA